MYALLYIWHQSSLAFPELIQDSTHRSPYSPSDMRTANCLGLFLNHFHGGGHKLTVHLLLVGNHIENQLLSLRPGFSLALLKQRGKPFQILFTVAIGSW